MLSEVDVARVIAQCYSTVKLTRVLLESGCIIQVYSHSSLEICWLYFFVSPISRVFVVSGKRRRVFLSTLPSSVLTIMSYDRSLAVSKPDKIMSFRKATQLFLEKYSKESCS